MTDNEKNVHDLTGLEANFEKDNGDKLIIIQLDKPLSTQYDTYPYFGFIVHGSHTEIYGYITHYNLMRKYTPLPNAKPCKWVTLKNMNDEDVLCEWKPTHLWGNDYPKMFMCCDDDDIVSISDNGDMIVATSIVSGYTPITNEPTALDMVDKMLEISHLPNHQTHRVVSKDKLKALKAQLEKERGAISMQ